VARESCVDIEVLDVPVRLLQEFDELVVKQLYPGSRSEAIRDLMRRAVREQRKP
jgi:metal-responsive CopG/Arc/MetJ family transcriptional regulator